MSSVLPKSIDYRELPNSLSSNITSTTQILNPVNSKSTYTANDIINFDFNSGNRGFIDLLVIKHHARLVMVLQEV